MEERNQQLRGARAFVTSSPKRSLTQDATASNRARRVANSRQAISATSCVIFVPLRLASGGIMRILRSIRREQRKIKSQMTKLERQLAALRAAAEALGSSVV